MQEYVTGVLSLFRNDNRILGWDLWNEPDNPASVYRNVELGNKVALVTELLPQVFPGTDIYLMYGLTEAFRSTYLPPARFAA